MTLATAIEERDFRVPAFVPRARPSDDGAPVRDDPRFQALIAGIGRPR